MNKAYNPEKIASHFSTYFESDVSNSAASLANSFSIRHNVYAEELQLEPTRDDKLETDSFDPHSFHCLIKHRTSNSYAGTVRIIQSRSEDERLPIEVYCEDCITEEKFHPSRFKREDIVEISRLAVPVQFRKRRADKFFGAATGGINEETYSEVELRCFPFISIGLYLTASAVLIRNNVEHCYVMVEPRLARSMRLVGLQFEQIGPVIDYHGKRAPFIINPMKVPGNLKTGFNLLLSRIMEDIAQECTFEHAKNK